MDEDSTTRLTAVLPKASRFELNTVAVHSFTFRVRYGETDQMGSYFNSRVLDWMEMGRTELSRFLGLPYCEWEKRGVFLPLVEAHVEFKGRARYDDLLRIATSVESFGRARLRFVARIEHAESLQLVARGYTVHALLNPQGLVIRIPEWVFDLLKISPA